MSQIPLKQSEKTGLVFRQNKVQQVSPVVEVLITANSSMRDQELNQLGYQVAPGSVAYLPGGTPRYMLGMDRCWYDQTGTLVFDPSGGEEPEPPADPSGGEEPPAEGEEPPAEVPV